MLDSYLVIAARGLDPSPPRDQEQKQAAPTPGPVLGAQAGNNQQNGGVNKPGAANNNIPMGGNGPQTINSSGAQQPGAGHAAPGLGGAGSNQVGAGGHYTVKINI